MKAIVPLQASRILLCTASGGDLTLTGGSGRTVFQLQMEVERLVATLLYEAEEAKPLALAQIEDVRLELQVHPSTLKLTTALGNLRVQDGFLSEVIVLGYACAAHIEAGCGLQFS